MTRTTDPDKPKRFTAGDTYVFADDDRLYFHTDDDSGDTAGEWIATDDPIDTREYR